jgi:hypothetical protein
MGKRPNTVVLFNVGDLLGTPDADLLSKVRLDEEV